MTAADVILRLRPVDSTSASIAAAVERAHAELAKADAAVVEAQRKRDAALWDAPAADLQDLERQLTGARTFAVEMQERIAAMLAQLETKLTAATLSEMLASLAAAKGGVEVAGTALSDKWERTRATIKSLISEMVDLETEWDQAYFAWRLAAGKTKGAYPELEPEHPMPTRQGAHLWQQVIKEMTDPPSRPVVHTPPTAEEEALAERREQHRRDNPTPDGFSPKLLRRA